MKLSRDQRQAVVAVGLTVLIAGLVVGLVLLTQSSKDAGSYSQAIRLTNTRCHGHGGVARIEDGGPPVTFVCKDGFAGTVSY